ncbi:MAG: DHA2 family efflux MFS transporter permease subunit [Rhizomicrobium sp.]
MPSTTSSPQGPLRKTSTGLRIAMICARLGTFMQVLDSTIANVALPYMQGGLKASRDQITWVLTSYIVAATIMSAPVGWIATQLGRKNYFLISLSGFTLMSALAGAATSFDQLIGLRILQGMFGAALSPLSQAVILERYPPERRGMIMSIWGMVVMIGPILGPVLGGFLTDNYSWRWVFYVNVPVGILAISGMAMFLSEDKPSSEQSFDWSGFAYFAVAIGALQFLLDRGTTKDWFSSSEIVVEAVLAGMGFYLFLVHFLTAKKTFIPHGLFRDRNYVSALMLTAVIGVLMLATSALMPPYLENLGGYSVLDVGMMLAPRGLGTMITMLIIGQLVLRIDVRIPMAIGALLLTWSFWEMSSWTPDISATTLSLTVFIQGIAMGMIFIPANIMAFATLPGHLRTDASAMINLARNLGSGIGISVTQSVLTMNSQVMHATLAVHASPFNRMLGVNAQSLMLNPRLPIGAIVLNGIITRSALITSYSDTFYMMMFMSVPAFVILMLIPKPDPTLPKAGEPALELIE